MNTRPILALHAEAEDAEIRGVVDERYQRSEGHGADAGHDSDRERNQAERQETDPPPLAPNRGISDEAGSIFQMQRIGRCASYIVSPG